MQFELDSDSHRDVSAKIDSFADTVFKEIDRDRDRKLNSAELDSALKSGNYSGVDAQMLKVLFENYQRIGFLSVEGLGVYPYGISKVDLAALKTQLDSNPAVSLALDLPRYKHLNQLQKVLADNFENLDKNSDGGISRSELNEVLNTQGLNMATETILKNTESNYEHLSGFFNPEAFGVHMETKKTGISKLDLLALEKALHPLSKQDPFNERLTSFQKFFSGPLFPKQLSWSEKFYDDRRRLLLSLQFQK